MYPSNQQTAVRDEQAAAHSEELMAESKTNSPAAVPTTTTDQYTTQERIILELEGIHKHFGDKHAVGECSLSVVEGELLTLLGPSGCGKTTTLRLIAGLERPDAGAIRVDDELIAGDGQFVSPQDRDIGVVFQNFALFPHLTAAENIAFGLDELRSEETDRRVKELLELVGLSDHGDSKPEELSGGQKQRIALARSLAPEPEILLLDEPFSNLDVDLRVEMREEVRRIIKEAGVTGISVTHDQEEAMSISDRVAVMHEGCIQQVGRPEDVFQRPQSRFVAGFLGHANFLNGSVSGDRIDTELGKIGRDQFFGLATQYDHMNIDVLIRPDDVVARPADNGNADGYITHRRYLGPTVLYRVALKNGETVETMHNHSDQLSLEEPVCVDLTVTHNLAWFPKEAHQ